MRGDGRTAVKWETAANQRKALDALANTLKPAELAVPKQVLDAIPPRPPGFGRHRELFPRTTGDAFDPLSPATVAADVTIGFTLQLDRAARMVAQHAVDPSLPGLEEVIDRLTKATFDAPAASPYEAEIRRAEERVLRGSASRGWPPARRTAQVRAIAAFKLDKLAARLRGAAPQSEAEQAQHALLAADIKRFLERPADTMRVMPAPDAPPGAPIGGIREWIGSRAPTGGRITPASFVWRLTMVASFVLFCTRVWSAACYHHAVYARGVRHNSCCRRRRAGLDGCG